MLQTQTQPRPHTQLASAPRHHGHLISGSLPELREDPLALLARVARENGDVARVRLMMDVHFINHPALVMRVMRENHQNYRKGALYDRLQGMLGDGLFTLEGEFWKKRRRLVQPAFHRQRIAALEEPVARRTDALIERWSRAAAGGTPVDVHADMTQLTLAVAGDALFGSDLLGEASEVGRAMAELLEVLDRRVSSIWVAPEWMPTPDNLRARAGKAVMDRVVRRVIEQRRSGPPTADLLGMLMEMRDADTGEGMTDEELRGEVLTMMVAGHETTANALTWTLWLLGQHPGTDTAGPCLPAVINESMRLYPPAWLIAREAISDDALGGFHVPAGSTVLASPWVLHRDPRFWGPDPEAFRPERFLGKEPVAGTFIPFAAGPRACVGNHFALLELHVVLGRILERFELRPGTGEELRPLPRVTLRPDRPVQMYLRLRRS